MFLGVKGIMSATYCKRVQEKEEERENDTAKVVKSG